jgi:hypothetical protein
MSSEHDDHDLYEYVTVDVGDERRPVSAHVQALVAYDVDGRDANEFTSLQDTHGSDLTSRVYHAYVDVHAVSDLELLRLGRQQVVDTPEYVTFDGVRAETRAAGEAEVRVGAYGGLPFYPFESSRSGTAVVGLYGSAYPWTGGSLRLDWMHLEDEALLGPHQDDLLSASLGQRLGAWQLQGDYSRLEDEDRDVRLRVSTYAPEADLSADLTFYQLLNAQRDHTLPLDPYFDTLFTLFPFWQGRFNVSKGFGEAFDLSAGIDLRRVIDADDVGSSNRDFERYWLTGNFLDLLPADFELGLTGDLWDAEGSDVYSWGLDLRRALAAGTDLALGTYYALYEYDLATGEEREHVRTWFIGVDWRQRDDLRLGVRYEFEDADIDEFHDVRVEATWSF